MTGNDVTWPEVTGSYPEGDIIPPEVAWRRLFKAETRGLGDFQVPQCCNMLEVTLTSCRRK